MAAVPVKFPCPFWKFAISVYIVFHQFTLSIQLRCACYGSAFLGLSTCLREPNNTVINTAVRHTYKNNEIVLNGLKKLDKEAVPKVNAAVGNT